MVHDYNLRFQDWISVLDIRIWRDREINGYGTKTDIMLMTVFRIYYIIMREQGNT
jgi:hypothetical protein